MFLFFPAYWLIISFSWNCSNHLPFLHLLSGFQNIFAIVSSPFLCPYGFVSFTSSKTDALEECEEGAGVIIHVCTHQLYPFFHLEKCFDWFDEHVG